MKFTFVKIDKNKQIKISTKKPAKLVEKIATDDSKLTVTRLRESVKAHPKKREYKPFPDLGSMTRIYPSAEFTKDSYDRMKMTTFNGLLLITLQVYKMDTDIVAAKAKAAALPYTYAAIIGADAYSLNVIVRIAKSDWTLPSDESGADKLCRDTYYAARPAYEKVTGMTVDGTIPSVRNNFLITVDEAPYFNENAKPLLEGSEIVLENPANKEINPANEETKPSIEEAKPVEKELPVAEEKAEVVQQENVKDAVNRMIDYLSGKYELRYNSVLRATECRDKNDPDDEFEAADSRVQNRMIIESRQANIDIDAVDLKTYLESDLIVKYDPIEEFLSSCRGKWDGLDHIRNLALTVPATCKEWSDWFYKWFLSFVHQMDTTRNDTFCNSIMPIIVGGNISDVVTFYRNLLPPELEWGFCDYLTEDSEEEIEKALSKSILICLKEFNHTNHSFKEWLFNELIDKTVVKEGDDYLPRIASIVGTSDIVAIMKQTSGGRRFLGVILWGSVDVTDKPDYTQLYAQALAALDSGESPYFNEHDLLRILKQNVNFQSLTATEMYFNEFFAPAKSKAEGVFLTSAEIMDYLRERTGFPLDVESNVTFGRKLSGIDGIISRRIARGVEYLVMKK